MRYWVGCTTTTVSTNLSCDIEIGHLRIGKEDGYYNWEKIGGQLNLRDEDGSWMYINNLGISICSTANPKDPYFYNDDDDGNNLVLLFNVPERFAEKLGKIKREIYVHKKRNIFIVAFDYFKEMA